MFHVEQKTLHMIRPAIYELNDDWQDDTVVIQEILKKRITNEKSFHSTFFFWDQLKDDFKASELSCKFITVLSPSLSFWGDEWKNKKFSQKYKFIIPDPKSPSIDALHPTPEKLKVDISHFVETNRNVKNCDILLCSHAFYHGLFLLEHENYTDLFIADYFYKKRSVETPMQWIRLYNNSSSATSVHLTNLIQVYRNEMDEISSECSFPIRICNKDRFEHYSELQKSQNDSKEFKDKLQQSELLVKSFITSDMMSLVHSNCHVNYILPIVHNNHSMICVAVNNSKDFDAVCNMRICLIQDVLKKTKTTKQRPGCCKRLSDAHSQLKPGCRVGIKYNNREDEASIGCFLTKNDKNYIITAGHAFTDQLESKKNVEIELIHGPTLNSETIAKNNKYYPGTISKYHKETFKLKACFNNEIINEKWKDVALIELANEIQYSNVVYDKKAFTEIEYNFSPHIGDEFNAVGFIGLVDLQFYSNLYTCNWEDNLVTKELAFLYTSHEKLISGDSGNIIFTENGENGENLKVTSLFIGMIDGYAIGISISDLIEGFQIKTEVK